MCTRLPGIRVSIAEHVLGNISSSSSQVEALRIMAPKLVLNKNVVGLVACISSSSSQVSAVQALRQHIDEKTLVPILQTISSPSSQLAALQSVPIEFVTTALLSKILESVSSSSTQEAMVNHLADILLVDSCEELLTVIQTHISSSSTKRKVIQRLLHHFHDKSSWMQVLAAFPDQKVEMIHVLRDKWPADLGLQRLEQDILAEEKRLRQEAGYKIRINGTEVDIAHWEIGETAEIWAGGRQISVRRVAMDTIQLLGNNISIESVKYSGIRNISASGRGGGSSASSIVLGGNGSSIFSTMGGSISVTGGSIRVSGGSVRI